MLALIIEIGLTVAAWKKGWGARALLPVGTMLAMAFVLGAIIGASGGGPGTGLAVGFLLDIACIAVLIRLASRAPYSGAVDATPAAVPMASAEPVIR